MCIAAPAKIVEIDNNVAICDFGGVKQKAKLDLVEADIGSYVLIHSGYAIDTLTEEAAKESLETWNELFEELENE
ncbi:HypC/HybG/HupF family hydrogenase formation chaperone [Methanosphaera cuniculi]|uniref:Hydrogenase n=1 Tax=Methanosphaera cuniculi TaxID=1077256 RepID=A0A2A2HCQ6_9EURY|nr:HypC/HybG/HupF family hydrogenase formation chaperone [Methanosphaera cuniculi]PAV07066.1 hydrogenase [Methanosphaera cuniculi]PWL07580.1 hydrogenase isoenzymes formation protein HypC [Methanosphaera cuniculi]